jgi:DNA (cytosine-5)-methyltransferase 1
MRYVVNAARPFIVPITHRGDDRVHGIDEPMRTVTTANRGEHAVIVPSVVGVGGRAGQSPERDAADPLGTVTASKRGTQALCAAFLAQHNGGMVGHDMRESVSTLTGKGAQQQVVAAYMAQHNGGRLGKPIGEPLSTIVHRGTQQQLVAATLSHAYSSNTCGGEGDPRQPARTVTAEGNHHALVAAFLEKYYGSGGQHQAADEPLHTATAKPRFGVVTVAVDGVEYAIVDIGMRMLTPRELFRAQGFPDDYVIDPVVTKRRGKREVAMPLDKTAQTKACGNSVCPHVGAALIRANLAAGAAAEAAE